MVLAKRVVRGSTSRENKEIVVSKKQIPIEEGLFSLPSSPDATAHLIGSRCSACGETTFPRRENCPSCFRLGMREIALSARGKVWTCTTMHYRPQQYEGPIPYMVGQVELPEGVLIPTILLGRSAEKQPEIGSEVELVVSRFGEDSEGNERMMYKFVLLG